MAGTVGELWPLLQSGLTAGLLYSLVAAGLWLVWRLAGVANFAQAEVAMVAAFIAYSTVARWGWLVALALALGTGALLGVALGRLTLRPADERGRSGRSAQPGFGALAATFGCMLMLRGGAGLLWGDQPTRWTGPWQAVIWPSSPFRVTWLGLGIALLALALCGGLSLWLRSSQAGLRLRAAVSNPNLAALTGYPARRLQQTAWLLGGLLAVPAGLAAALAGLMEPGFMADWTLPAFIIILLVPAIRPLALVPAGLTLGLTQHIVNRVAPPGWGDIVLFVLLACVVTIRARSDGEPA